MGKLHQGEFKPKHPEKYKGNYPIFYRSSWELKMMNQLDSRPDVIFWSSESIQIQYYNPVKRKMARYFPDFKASFKNKDGNIMTYIIEIKPYKETVLPVSTPRQKSKTKLYQELTYVINKAKWEAAEQYCKNNGLKFQLITEKELYRFK